MVKDSFNINNYDCRNSYEKVSKDNYFEFYVKANESLLVTLDRS